MNQIKQLIRLYQDGSEIKMIDRIIGMSKNAAVLPEEDGREGVQNRSFLNMRLLC